MTWRTAAAEHARAEFPREACGLVVIRKGREVYRPCVNRAIGDEHFMIAAEDYAAAEDEGTIVGVFHSHPYAPAEPSEADLVSCERSGVEWHILSLPNDVWHSFKPSGYVPPLEGRQFCHGVLDCYSIVRDWYRQERGIVLKDYVRRDDWWERGESLYLDNFCDAGFVDNHGELVPGAVLLMQIGASVPNHAAVYLGDGLILHHLHGRLSSRDVYGGYYQHVTVKVLRYEGSPPVRTSG